LDVAATITGGGDGVSLLGDVDEDRRVFSQARGEDEDSHLRRYAVRTQDDVGFCERDRDNGGLEFTEVSERSLRSELEAHVDERVRVETGDDVNDGEDVDEEIERRLSALGYKE
jgi:arylsulfatase